MGKKLHFKSKEAYRKWLAYNWIHNKKEMGDGRNSTIYIRGKKHRVNHSRKKHRKKKRAFKVNERR